MKNTDLWNEIIYYLQGSCNSLTDALEAFKVPELLDDMDFLEYLDSNIFLCNTCGWWCDMGELEEESGDLVCISCIDE